MMTASRALIRPSGEDAMGRSCILDAPPQGQGDACGSADARGSTDACLSWQKVQRREANRRRRRLTEPTTKALCQTPPLQPKTVAHPSGVTHWLAAAPVCGSVGSEWVCRGLSFPPTGRSHCWAPPPPPHTHPPAHTRTPPLPLPLTPLTRAGVPPLVWPSPCPHAHPGSPPGHDLVCVHSGFPTCRQT